MDNVKRFIAANHHQLGYIMHEASREWIKLNPSGALTVGPCNAEIIKFGEYRDILDKLHAIEDILRKDE